MWVIASWATAMKRAVLRGKLARTTSLYLPLPHQGAVNAKPGMHNGRCGGERTRKVNATMCCSTSHTTLLVLIEWCGSASTFPTALLADLPPLSLSRISTYLAATKSDLPALGAAQSPAVLPAITTEPSSAMTILPAIMSSSAGAPS